MKKQIVILGMGLIGGSLSMALRGFEDYEVVGVDRDPPTLAYARDHAVAGRHPPSGRQMWSSSASTPGVL